MGVKEKLKRVTYWIEDNFFFSVIRHGMTMMIPLLLIGGIACALMNLPYVDYTSAFLNGILGKVYLVLNMIYQGTFGIFSLVLVITLSLCYGMERNQMVEKAAMYVVVAVGAYGTQLNIGSEYFQISDLGITGSFSAIVVTLLSCFIYEKVKKNTTISLKKYTMGMENICVTAMSTIFPMTVVIAVVVLITQVLSLGFGVHSINDLFSTVACGIFDRLDNNYGSGLLYTFLLHLLWLCGFHGSHLLEPVAQSTFATVSEEAVFSKSFFDTYVVMGGCGTTICVLLLLLLFYRKDRMGRLAKVGSFAVIFNLNEVLNFGIPIILNPVMAIPFLLTPMVSYSIAYLATAMGWVPHLVQEIPWSTPILLSGYMATGSIRGTILQLVCVLIGMRIYYPFIRLNKRVQENYAKERLRVLVKTLKEMEEANEEPKFLNRGDSFGMMSRMLLEDLEKAIKNDDLYLVYQPQVDNDGKCVGAEALLRWIHPLYGEIYPPLTIYLAKQGELLPELEKRIFEMAVRGISQISQAYDGKFKISVNITAKSLQWDVVPSIENSLKKYQVAPEYLWVEITEQDVLSNKESVVSKIRELKNCGHTLLIDDFGMGHTSLIYLQSNYFGVVKLDGSLVRNILENETNQKIVASIVELAGRLGIKVISEYVETEEHWNKLKELGCDWYQGYLFSKPISLEEFIEYLINTNGEVQKKYDV